MSQKTIHNVGIVMNGVTGRMGLNQHLRRSLWALMQQGGLSLSDREAIMRQHGGDRVAARPFVIDHQNFRLRPFEPLFERRANRFHLKSSGLWFNNGGFLNDVRFRKDNSEFGANINFRFHFHRALVAPNDAETHCEAKTHSSFPFGGEERVENARLNFSGHASAVVANRNDN